MGSNSGAAGAVAGVAIKVSVSGLVPLSVHAWTITVAGEPAPIYESSAATDLVAGQGGLAIGVADLAWDLARRHGQARWSVNVLAGSTASGQRSVISTVPITFGPGEMPDIGLHDFDRR